MTIFGLKINSTTVANFGRLTTQALPITSHTLVANTIAQSSLTQNSVSQQAVAQIIQTNTIIAQILPPVVINSTIPTTQQSTLTSTVPATNTALTTAAINIARNPTTPTINQNTINTIIPTPAITATLSGISPITTSMITNPILRIPPRIFTAPVIRIPKTTVRTNKIAPPNPDTLRLSEVRINDNTFEIVPRNGISVYRPEILGMVNFNPIFWPENKNEFTEAGQFLSLNYQMQTLRRSTLDKIIQKIQKSNDQNLIKSLTETINTVNNVFSLVEKKLKVFASNAKIIKDINNAFDIKEIDDNAYNKIKFLTLKQFFERKMQYNEQSYKAFSDTKILMQIIFDLQSSLEGYSFSLLNLQDEDRRNDLNPIVLDKTYTRNNNFTFSIESIRSSGVSGRLAMDTNEFTQFINSLPSDQSDKLKLLLHLLSKELRVSRGLSKTVVRSNLQRIYSATPDGNPFDNILGSFGKDIFDPVQGENSLASLTQITGNNFTVLPFETKTVDDSQTTYIPGTKYFSDAILNSSNNFNLNPFNEYTSKYSDILSKTTDIIEQLFDFENQNFNLLPEEIFLDFLQTLQDGLSSLGGNSQNSNSDQMVFAALIRLANKDNILKLMLFQFFLLTGIASINKQDNKKIFQRLIEDVQNQIRKFSYVRVSAGDDPDLTKGLATLRPYLERLATDIETRVFNLLNPFPIISFVPSPVVRSMIPPQTDRFSSIVNAGSLIPFGIISGDSNRMNSSVNSLIQTRTPHSAIRIGVTTATTTTNRGTIFDRNAIKNILLTGIIATDNSSTNLLKEFVDLALKFDNNASIQGNSLSYVLENNSTRFNFISTSHLLLFIFEIISSFIGRFFVSDFTEVTNFSKISLTFNDSQNRSMFDYIKDLTSQRNKRTTIPVLTTALLRLPITPAPPPLKNLTVSPSFLLSNTVANINPVKTALSAINQMSVNVLGGISTMSPLGSIPRGNTANKSAATSLSVMLENISNMSLTSTNTKTGINNQRIGSAGSVNRTFISPTVGIESIKNAINTNILPINNIIGTNFSLIDPAALRKLNDLKQTLIGIKDKIKDEDVYIQNSLHILDVIGDRLSLVNSRVNHYFTSLNDFEKQTINQYKDTIQNGQIKTSNWIEQTYKQNANIFGSFNVTYRDEFFALISLLSDKFYTNNLSGNRVKLLAIGIPAGFTEKLIDRISRDEIDAQSLKNLESDVVYINVYKKNSANDDIVYYPQRFLFDLSLYPKEITNLNLNPKLPFEKQMDRISVLNFENITNIIGESIDITSVLVDEKYSFLNTTDKRELMKNHITSYLLQTYVYLLTGISFSEEVFPSNPYVNLGPTATLNTASETLLRAYFKTSMGFDYPAQRSILDTLTDSTIPDTIKDDIQLMLYGSNMLNPELIEAKILTRKKFDRILLVPINVDDFIIDVNQTRQTASGKKAFTKSSYQKNLIGIPMGNNVVFKENREFDQNALIFEEYFITINTARKV